jgi:hypothetical protein
MWSVQQQREENLLRRDLLIMQNWGRFRYESGTGRLPGTNRYYQQVVAYLGGLLLAFHLSAFFLHSFTPLVHNKIAECYNRYKTKKGDSCLDPLLGFGITPAHPCHLCQIGRMLSCIVRNGRRTNNQHYTCQLSPQPAPAPPKPMCHWIVLSKLVAFPNY